MIITSREHRIPVIYRITCTVNGKIYVGSTNNLYFRSKFYKRAANGHTQDRTMAIHSAMMKYGFDKFEFDILEKVEDVLSLMSREQHWMDTLQPFGAKGYNISRDAKSVQGHKYPPEQRREIERKKGNWVYQIDQDSLKVIATFDSSEAATRALSPRGSSARGGVSSALRGANSSAYGYYWAYKTDHDVNGFIPRPRRSRRNRSVHKQIRPFYQMDEKGKVIRLWKSMSEAKRICNYDTKGLWEALNNERRRAYGFRWKRVEDLQVIEQARTEMQVELQAA